MTKEQIFESKFKPTYLTLMQEFHGQFSVYDVQTIRSAKSIEELYKFTAFKYRLLFVDLLAQAALNFGLINVKTFSEMLSDTWTSSENPNSDPNVDTSELNRLFRLAKKEYLMSEEDKAYFDSLPDEITVYRGINTKYSEKRGLSWTIDKDRAIWFATRTGKTENSKLYTSKVKKEDIYCYLSDRGESEVVVDIYHIGIEEIEF